MSFLIHFHRSIISTSSKSDQFYTHLKGRMSRNKINQTKDNSIFHGEVVSTKFKGSDSYNLYFGVVCKFKYVHIN